MDKIYFAHYADNILSAIQELGQAYPHLKKYGHLKVFFETFQEQMEGSENPAHALWSDLVATVACVAQEHQEVSYFSGVRGEQESDLHCFKTLSLATDLIQVEIVFHAYGSYFKGGILRPCEAHALIIVRGLEPLGDTDNWQWKRLIKGVTEANGRREGFCFRHRYGRKPEHPVVESDTAVQVGNECNEFGVQEPIAWYRKFETLEQAIVCLAEYESLEILKSFAESEQGKEDKWRHLFTTLKREIRSRNHFCMEGLRGGGLFSQLRFRLSRKDVHMMFCEATGQALIILKEKPLDFFGWDPIEEAYQCGSKFKNFQIECLTLMKKQGK